MAKRVKISEVPTSAQREFILIVLIFAASAIALVWLYFNFLAPSPPIEPNVTPEITPVVVKIEAEEITENIQVCLAKYGLDDKTVIFIYEDACEYSQQNVPFVRQLEAAGHKFYWAKPSSPSSIIPITACLEGVAKLSGTPEFVCPAKRKSELGAFGSKDELLAFVMECIK